MPDYFFVGGSPKSGTTWLQRMLDAHRHVTCSGEAHVHEKLVKPFAAALTAYNDSITAYSRQVYGDRPYYRPVDLGAVYDMVRPLAIAILGQRATPDSRMVGDKTPRNSITLRNLDHLFPGARFIDITRDPRDVAVSALHHLRRQGLLADDPLADDRRHDRVREVAQAWAKSQQSVAGFAAERPDAMLLLRYEDMIAAPVAEMRRAFAFLGVDADPATVEPIVAANAFEAMSGRQPGQEDAGSFLRKGIVGDWQQTLDADTVAAVEQVCGADMARRGYALAGAVMAG